MMKNITFNPKLAPKTAREARSKSKMTSRQHGEILHQRSKQKEMRKLMIKQEQEEKEMANCTFTP